MPEDDFVESQGSVSQGWLKLLCCSHTISQNSSSSLVLHFTGKDRRIIELFELEGTLESDRVQLSCNEQGHLQLDQVAQSPVQPDLECLQGQGFYHLSGQPVPQHAYCKKLLPYIQILLYESEIVGASLQQEHLLILLYALK